MKNIPQNKEKKLDKKPHPKTCKCCSCEAKRGNNVWKSEWIIEKNRKRMKKNNPMKNPDVVKKMVETSRKNGVYIESSKRLKQLHILNIIEDFL